MIQVMFFAPVVVLAALSILSRELPREPYRRGAPAARQWSQPTAYYFTKALPMLWMLGYYCLWYWTEGFAASRAWSLELKFWILLGLALGTAGDIFLLFRGWFLPGFVAFAAGHLYYLVGFASLPWNLSVLAVVLLCVPGLIYGPLIAWLTPRKKMLPFILFYLLLINGMFLTASNATTWAASFPAAARIGATGAWGIAVDWFPLSLAAGAALFCVSDGCWAYNRFVRPLPYSGVWVLSTYYAGQAFIVWGAMQLP